MFCSWYNEILTQRTPLSQRPSSSSKMLASRVLPPLLQSSPTPPVATFFNIPRRYVKSNMQVGNNASHSPMEDVDSGRNLRKSSRLHDSRIAPTSSPVQRAREEELPSPVSSSPRVTRNRISSFDVEVNGRDSVDGDSPTDSRALRSASSTGSGELSGHVCLCQPEPKIPRPRNGKSDFLFIPDVDIPASSPSLSNKEFGLCLRSCLSAADPL